MFELNRPIRFSRTAKFITVTVITLLALLLLHATSHVALPFVWAIVTAYILNPLVTRFSRRTGTRRFWGVLLVFSILIGLLVLLVTSLVPILMRQYNGLVEDLPGFLEQAQSYVERNDSIDLFGFQLDLRQQQEQFFNSILDWATSLTGHAPDILKTIVEGFIYTLVYLVVTFYLLLDAERIMQGLYGLVPAPYRWEIQGLFRSIDRVLGAYIRGQLILIGIMSVLSYIALSILQVRYALVIAIATGILEIIPFVGPYAATMIAASVALLQGTTPFGWEPWVLALVVVLIYFALRQFEDHVIIPMVVGHIVELHPVLVIFAILAGGVLAGALGLLIAIPVAAVIRIILVYLYGKLVDAEPTGMPGVDASPPSGVAAQQAPVHEPAVAESSPSQTPST